MPKYALLVRLGREISSPTLDIRGLDLSLTLIPSWKVVAEITAELQFLSQLSLKSVPDTSSFLNVAS